MTNDNKSSNGLQQRMNDFMFKVTTADGQTKTISSRSASVKPEEKPKKT